MCNIVNLFLRYHKYVEDLEKAHRNVENTIKLNISINFQNTLEDGCE